VTDWLGLEGRRVLVAGAGGIGSECVAGFAAAGARVVVTDRDEAKLAALDDRLQLRRHGGGTVVADLLDAGASSAVVAEAEEVLGGVDVLLHSVGMNDRRPVLDFSDEDWDTVIGVNLTSAFRLARAVGCLMTAQGSGCIVFLSSVSGLLAHKNHAPYAASKGGLNQLLRVMAAEWASTGVRVNAVAPGYVETDLTRAHLDKPGVRVELQRLVPAGRLGTASEVVGPVLFLASEQAGFVTGHVLYVDGGRTLV
jgi:gluconate 5-dehydrogenase